MPVNKPERKYLNTPNGYVIYEEKETRIKRNAKPSLIKTPKNLLIVILLGILFIGTAGTLDMRGIINTAFAVTAAVAVDIGLAFRRYPKIKTPSGSILTGLIIGLVLSSAVPWYETVLTAVAAILSKHFLRVRKKPIFNPAAFGLFLAILLFDSGQSWWGGFSLLPAWSILFLFIGGYFITHKVNKFPQVFSFLGTYFTICLILALMKYRDIFDVLRNPFINSVLFLAFFMVTDPPTSPAKNSDQIKFGIIAAVISVISYLLFGGLAFLLIGLLAANGWKAYKTYRVAKVKG